LNSEIWWEKTVEYAFVVAASQEGKFDFAAPFAGRHERLAADAMFAKASKFVLVEFKRNKDEIPTEKSLFHCYEDAKTKLANYYHHNIVFAIISEGTLQLAAQTYFSAKPCGSALDCLSSGVDESTFLTYLGLLAELKKEDGRSSSGHISPEALSTVMGITENGKIVDARPLYEYAPALFPAQIYRPDHSESSSPSPGG